MDGPKPRTPAVPPVGNVAPGGRGIAISARSIAIVGLLLATFAFFGLRAALDREAPTVEELAAAFTPLVTFEYEAPPPEALQVFETGLANEPEVAHFDARLVSAQGQPVATVLILAVDPDALTEPFRNEYEADFEKDTQAPTQDLEIGDSVGHLASTDELGTVIFFFDDNGFVFHVLGPDSRTVEAIARVLEVGNS